MKMEQNTGLLENYNVKYYRLNNHIFQCIIHMKAKLDIKYIVKINNGVRFGHKRTDSDRKEPTPIDELKRREKNVKLYN